MTDRIEIGYCRDCKYWVEEPGDYEDGCTNPKPRGMYGSEWADDEWFDPHPDFGCVYWEEKADG